MNEPTVNSLAESPVVRWIPSPGPQTAAFFCEADVLLFGGSGGGGKTESLLGIALTAHKRSLIMRRHYVDLGAISERLIEINGTRQGYNGSIPPKLRTDDGRLIELGAAATVGDEQSWQGQPHDLLAFDEACQFAESQVRFLMGWVRSTDPDQRCRVILASNPPLGPEGDWVIGMFAPWLDDRYPNPAKHGELRWFVTDPEGKDLEVDGPEPVELDGRELIPMSRTFIPATIDDNPYLASTGYKASLDALPEPIRSAIRDGNFMAARQDDAFQVIPTTWIHAAQQRWEPTPPYGIPMCAIGVDVAQGGLDETVLAIRHDGWYAPLIAVPGRETPDGPSVAGLVVSHRRDDAKVVIDMGGGYGGAPLEHLKANGIPVLGFKGAEKSVRRTVDKQLGFANKRAEAYWRFREALDPGQPGGSPISLPDDRSLLADLAAPTFEVGTNGIKLIPKEKLIAKLGRSPDKGDAIVMAWFDGARASTHIQEWRPDQRVGGQVWKRHPQVDFGPRYHHHGPSNMTSAPRVVRRRPR